jgi:hypothetical protein
MAARAALAIAVAALAWPGAADAHIRTGRIAADYRVSVDRVPRGVSAHVYSGDRAIRVGVPRGHTLVVPGFLGIPPPVRIGPTGRRSVVFHDPRITSQLVPGVRSARWTIPLVVDGRRASLSGRIEPLPKPALWPWLAVGVPFVAAAVVLVRRRRLPELERAALVLGALVVAAITATAGGLALDANSTEGRWVEAANELVFAAIVLVVLIRGRPQTRVLAAGALGLLGLAVGVSKIPVFTHPIVLSLLPDAPARAAVALMLWASVPAVAIGGVVFVETLDDEPQLRGAADV